MPKCKAHTKSGNSCKNEAAEGGEYCHIHKESSDKILHPKKRAMIDALEASLGVVTTATKKVGISRQTHYQWLEDDPAYKRAVNELNNVALDFVESQLFKQIKDGGAAQTIFFLKTRGKKRGYTEHITVGVDDQKGMLSSLMDALKEKYKHENQ